VLKTPLQFLLKGNMLQAKRLKDPQKSQKKSFPLKIKITHTQRATQSAKVS